MGLMCAWPQPPEYAYLNALRPKRDEPARVIDAEFEIIEENEKQSNDGK